MLLAISLTLGGCKSNNKEGLNGTPSTEHINAVKLLEPEMLISKDEAAKLIGEAVQDAKKSETAVVGMKLCVYNAVDPSSNNYLQVSLTQDSFMPHEGVGSERIYRELKKMLTDSRTDIKELGSEAFIANGGLYLFKNGYYILISTGNNASKDKKIAVLKNAGKQAIEKLENLR